jgi:membrane-bound inhibitor of C-type lysozyme
MLRLEMLRPGLALAFLSCAMLAVTPASAQKFVNYVCDDGTPLTAAFFPGDRAMRMQLSGKALALPQRLAASGARYAKGGVSFWIKGQEATLKQPKRKATTCRAQ